MDGMFCRICQYRLDGLPGGTCPECGRPFDPENSWSFLRRRRRLQWLVGLVWAVVVATLVVLGYRLAYTFDFNHSWNAAFFVISGIGLSGSVLAAFLAAWNRSWWGRAPLLFIGIMATWTGLAFGSDKGYRVWQSMPDAPDEAFADTDAILPLLVGWLPGIFVAGTVFGVVFLGFQLVQRWGEGRAGA